MNEVHKIAGPEHNFLMGFYYRLTNRPDEAIDRYKRCLNDRVVSNRSRRELVQVYISVNDYSSANTLARDNYEEYPLNPHHIQAYLNTLINNGSNDFDVRRIEELIKSLESVGSDIANEMAAIAKAEYTAKCLDNYGKAKVLIEEAVSKYSDSHYPLLSKAFLAARYGDLNNLGAAYSKLKEIEKRKNVSSTSLAHLEASKTALEGDLIRAIKIAEKNLDRYPKLALEKILNELTMLSEQKRI